MLFGISKCSSLLAALAALAGVSGEGWRWPDDAAGAESVRIDAKVGFVDAQAHRSGKRNNRDDVQADEIQAFQQPTDTQGFYNQPPGSGRYPVRVQQGYDNEIRINGRPAYNVDDRNQKQQYQTDGTLDSLQYCVCAPRPRPDCQRRTDYSKNACGEDQYLCCYKGPGNQNGFQSESFNEVGYERPMLFPSQANNAANQHGVLVGPDGPSGIIGVPNEQVLVGPGGLTGVIGPDRPVLVGPQGPTGVIGPADGDRNGNLLGRPLGPGGDVAQSGTAQRGVLVGPGGPTGIIGPAFNRPVLVGPSGPTGIIGPSFNRPILVGPRGPTGVIGPTNFNRNSRNPGILVGPGGPTGIIGPGKQILVGPGGPTGRIGPRNYFGK